MGALAIGAMLAGDTLLTPRELDRRASRRAPTAEQLHEKVRQEKEWKERKRRKNLGLQEFRYGEQIVYARNQKNADRKARNQGLISNGQ